MFSGIFGEDTSSTSDGGIRSAQLSPAYLQANATSHTWVFSAIAELVDNAYDPDANASRLWITRQDIAGHTCLVFTDNGNGMTREKLHKMLSFGYSEKEDTKNHKAVGQYGNGFKSGSMRLGKDVIVFTRCNGSKSVGMLSQTYLENSKSQNVQLPIVTWDSNDKMKASYSKALEAITDQGLFNSNKQLLEQFASFSDHLSGTQIIIYNLKKDSLNRLELDFESDHTDILYSEHVIMDQVDPLQPRDTVEHRPLFRRSLKEYLSILYLKPKMHIYLRERRIRTRRLKNEMSNVAVDIYTPRFLPHNQRVEITFGQMKSHDDCGIMLYHKNRLIKGFEKVGILKKRNGAEGLGVVGIVDVDFFEPVHNKQDFNKTDPYITFLKNIASKLSDFWEEKIEGKPSAGRRQVDTWLWVQCDGCAKWRRLQCDVNTEQPERWYCHMNQDPSYNRCEDAEERLASVEEDVVTTPYTKARVAQKRKERREKKQLQEAMFFARLASPGKMPPVHLPSEVNANDQRTPTKRSLSADANKTQSPSKVRRTQSAIQQVSASKRDGAIERSSSSLDGIQPGPSLVTQGTLTVSQTQAPSSAQLARRPIGSNSANGSHSTWLQELKCLQQNRLHEEGTKQENAGVNRKVEEKGKQVAPASTNQGKMRADLLKEKKRNEDLQRKLQDREKDMSAAVQVNLGLQIDLAKSEERQSLLDKQLKELPKANKDKTRLENEMSRAKREIQSWQEKFKALENEFSVAKIDAAKRREEIDELARLKVRDLTKELSDIKKALSNGAHQNSALQKQLDEAKQREDQFRTESKAQEKIQADLREALTKAREAVSQAEQNTASLERQLDSAVGKKSAFMTDVKQKTETIMELRTELEKSRDESKDLAKDLVSKGKALSDALKHNTVLKKELSGIKQGQGNLSSELEQERKKVFALNVATEQNKRQQNELMMMCSELQKTLCNTDKARLTLQQQMKDAKQKENTLSSEVSRLSKDNVDLNAELERCRRNNTDLAKISANVTESEEDIAKKLDSARERLSTIRHLVWTFVQQFSPNLELSDESDIEEALQALLCVT